MADDATGVAAPDTGSPVLDDPADADAFGA
jgi:hypothetical protein